MMEAALQMTMEQKPTTTMESVSQRINKAKEQGVSMQAISNETGINRSLISTLCNHGMAAIKQEGLERLDAWCEQYERKLQGNLKVEAVPVLDVRPTPFIRQYKTKPGLIHTTNYTAALGFCKKMADQHKIGVLIGAPGTGKTTVAKTLCELYPSAIYIEAWQSMRLGDLLDEIAYGVDIQLRGTLNRKTHELINALKGSNTILVVDEAEYLKKWNVEKLDVLRKIHDNTGICVILIGTPAFKAVLNRADTTQLSRRMFLFDMRGALASEVKEALNGYNIAPDAADALARIAADTAHGGLGSYTMMLELCLDSVRGGEITMQTLADAKRYKPGLA